MTSPSAPGIPELLAAAPHPELAPALQLYGQFVGSWDQDITWYERAERRAAAGP